MALNVVPRPIFLCRPGQTLSDITTDQDDDYVVAVNMKGTKKFKDMSAHSRKGLLPGDQLGPGGKNFKDVLCDFVFEECVDFALKQASIADIKIFSSTMPRAVETVRWDKYHFPVTELSTLNPLDKGDFVGKEMEEIQTTNPSWYSRLAVSYTHLTLPTIA